MSEDSNFFDFLHEEYNYYSRSFHKSEDNGEKVLNFFITISTAVLGGVIALITNHTKLAAISQ